MASGSFYGITLQIGGSRGHAPAAALAACAATLALGFAGPPRPGGQMLFGWGGIGIVLCTSIGMLVWHVARMRSVPAGASGLYGAALPASVLALATPMMGITALLVPCTLAILCLRRDSEQRLAACAVLIGAAMLLSDSPLGNLASAAIPAIAWLTMRGAALPFANDNPSLERIADIWPLQEGTTYANRRPETSESGSWGVA